MQFRHFGCAFFVFVMIATACSKDEVGPSPSASPTPSVVVSAPPQAPAKKGPARIELNAETLIVSGESLGSRDEWSKRLAIVLAGERVTQEAINLEVDRKAKPSAVRQVLEAVRAQKPKSLAISTTHRSGNLTKIETYLGTAEPEACVATGFISKEASISVWAASGTTAQKFAKGLGGPDMTMGGGALSKARAACPSGRVVVGADDVVIWGLIVDLVVSSTPPLTKDAVELMLVDGLVPGRKVKLAN